MVGKTEGKLSSVFNVGDGVYHHTHCGQEYYLFHERHLRTQGNPANSHFKLLESKRFNHITEWKNLTEKNNSRT